MKPYCVFLVEDNPADVLLIEESLRECQVLVDLCHFDDGEKAVLALNDRRRPQADLIVLDLHTPRAEGMDILRSIRDTPSTHCVPVIILTSSMHPKDRAEAEQIGVSAFIQKPARLEEFITTIGGTIARVLSAQVLT